MILGQRVVWLVPGKVGRVTARNEIKRTVDIEFEDDGSTRGDIPIAQVVAVEQGDVALPTVVGAKKPQQRPSSIPSRERFGTPGLS